MLTNTFLLASLASLASAHIMITSPKPYGKSTLNNSPLDGAGADFPCKQRTGVYDAEGASNVFAQGSTQQLAFVGTAVHGGGSCQVSVTTDEQPDKNSVWKVIQSIEGGCPAKGQTGNLGDNANAPVPYKYAYTIPKDLASGNYTLAWTWNNKVGNREMYMNCAPLTVTGSGGDDKFMDTLPDMFVANIGNGCTVPESKDVEYPSPGTAVNKFNGATNAFWMPTIAACKAGGGSGGAAPTTTDGGSQPTSPPAPTSTAPGGGGGIFITTQPADATVTSAPAAPTEPATTAPAAPATTAPSTGGGSGGGSGSGGSAMTAGSACTTEGEWNCVGGSSFQRCASGAWSAVQAMAAGVTCKDGQSSELTMVSKKGKRAMRRALRVSP